MRLNKIVVGIDFSDASLAAARWATRRVARDGQIYLVCVLPEPFTPLYLSSFGDPALDQISTYRPGVYGALKGFGDALRSDRVRVGVRIGNPAQTLARVAGEVKADLICVGRGGRRQGGSRFGATTPQRLLSYARVPVLIVPSTVKESGDKSVTDQRVLAAVDARTEGDEVLEVAAALAADWDMDLEAVHVVEVDSRDPSFRNYLGLDAAGVTSLADEWVKSRLAVVEGGSRGRVSIRWGDPGPELVSCAQDGSALLVIGRETQRSPVVFAGNFPSGSTTRYALWSAPCPLLVLPPTTVKPVDRPPSSLSQPRGPQRSNASTPTTSGAPLAERLIVRVAPGPRARQ